MREYIPKAWFLSLPLERCLPFARILRTLETILAARLLHHDGHAVVLPSRDNVQAHRFVTREHLHLLTR